MLFYVPRERLLPRKVPEMSGMNVKNQNIYAIYRSMAYVDIRYICMLINTLTL